MNKVFFLSTCDTCKRIIKELDLKNRKMEFQDIKHAPISAEDLDFCKDVLGSYEQLFSRKARKYKELGLSTKSLSETEIRAYILSDYTFLKRPVFINGKKVFAGNDKSVILNIKENLN